MQINDLLRKAPTKRKQATQKADTKLAKSNSYVNQETNNKKAASPNKNKIDYIESLSLISVSWINTAKLTVPYTRIYK